MSNLLDKASIILTPTAYNNGEALCVKPSDGSGDFDFSRNSAATRVNEQGLVEDVQSLSSELVTNGNFATDSDWTKGTGWSISGGSANCDGTQTGGTSLYQSVFQQNKSYKITFSITSITAGGVGVVNSPKYTTTGTFTYYYNVTGTDSNLYVNANTDFIGSIDNVSVKEVIDNTNLPRINYDGFSFDGSGNIISDSGCGSWLFEPQSTNLITQSELFSNSSWTKSNTTIVSNVLTSPDGTINADNLKDTANNSIHRLRDGVALLANTDYTISVFAKKGTLSNLQVALLNTADSKIASRVFNLENGTLGEELTATGGTLQNSEIKDYGNGWYRCSITAQLTTTPNQAQLTLAPLSSGNTQTAKQVTYLGNGTGTVSIWGAQLEQQSYATSYIPTDGTQKTRNQDVCNNGGSVSTINSTEGVLYFEGSTLGDFATTRYVSINNGNTNNLVAIGFFNDSTIKGRIVIGGTTVYFSSGLVDQTETLKIALKYKLNDYALWVNGVEVASNISLGVFAPNTLTRVAFGRYIINDFFGKTKCLAVWKEALTDTELQELTTI